MSGKSAYYVYSFDSHHKRLAWEFESSHSTLVKAVAYAKEHSKKHGGLRMKIVKETPTQVYVNGVRSDKAKRK